MSDAPDAPGLSKAERRQRLRAARGLAPKTLARLSEQHPNAKTELDYRTPFELIVSGVLRAQTTDVSVNKAPPKLFARYPDAAALAAADPKDVEPFVGPLGFFRMKARSIT